MPDRSNTQTFAIEVARVSYAVARIIVNAEDEKQAADLALSRAGDLEFRTHGSEYEVHSVASV